MPVTHLGTSDGTINSFAIGNAPAFPAATAGVTAQGNSNWNSTVEDIMQGMLENFGESFEMEEGMDTSHDEDDDQMIEFMDAHSTMGSLNCRLYKRNGFVVQPSIQPYK